MSSGLARIPWRAGVCPQDSRRSRLRFGNSGAEISDDPDVSRGLFSSLLPPAGMVAPAGAAAAEEQAPRPPRFPSASQAHWTCDLRRRNRQAPDRRHRRAHEAGPARLLRVPALRDVPGARVREVETAAPPLLHRGIVWDRPLRLAGEGRPAPALIFAAILAVLLLL